MLTEESPQPPFVLHDLCRHSHTTTFKANTHHLNTLSHHPGYQPEMTHISPDTAIYRFYRYNTFLVQSILWMILAQDLKAPTCNCHALTVESITRKYSPGQLNLALIRSQAWNLRSASCLMYFNSLVWEGRPNNAGCSTHLLDFIALNWFLAVFPL